MIFRNPNQRVAVLVDVQNLYYSAKNLYSARINFKNLLNIAVNGRILTRAIAYVIKADQGSGELDFFEALNNAGFEVNEKELQVFAGGAKKGDWDLGIAMDAIRLGHKVDSIVLISGDGDFKPVVNYLQQSLGCLVEVVAFKQTANHELIEIADDFIDIESHKSDLLFKSKPLRVSRSLNPVKRVFAPRTSTKQATPNAETEAQAMAHMQTQPRTQPRIQTRPQQSDSHIQHQTNMAPIKQDRKPEGPYIPIN